MSSPLVYLVEDSEMLSMLYQDYLRAEPYQIKAFRLGQDGLDALKEQPPQVLLLDLELPDMDGMALLRYVSEQGLPTSVVVITAHGSVDIAVMVTKKGGKFTTFIWDRDHGPLHEQALNLIKMAVDSQTKRKTLFGANTLSKESDLGRKVLGESFSSTDKSEKILQIMHDFFSN